MQRGGFAAKAALGLLAVALLGAGLWWLLTPVPKPAPTASPHPTFDGTRGQVSGAVYTEEDPATGIVTVIRAARAVTRDGKVGKLFRTPLKQRIELSRVEVEVRGREGGVLLRGEAPKGSYAPGRKELILERPGALRVGDREVKTGRIILKGDGSLRVPGEYEVRRAGEPVHRGYNYAGLIAALGKVGAAPQALSRAVGGESQ